MGIVGYEDDIVGADGDLEAASLPQSFVGSPPTDIPASSTGVTIEVRVLRVFRPDRLVFDRSDAAKVFVKDIKIGTVSLNASNNQVPGDMFAPDATNAMLRQTQTASPNLSINCTIGNRTAVAITALNFGFIGPSAAV